MGVISGVFAPILFKTGEGDLLYTFRDRCKGSSGGRPPGIERNSGACP